MAKKHDRVTWTPPIPLYYAGVNTGKATCIMTLTYDDGSEQEVAFEVDHVSQAVRR